MPVLFSPELFGPPELSGWSQNVEKLAGIRPEPIAKPVFGTDLVSIVVVRTLDL